VKRKQPHPDVEDMAGDAYRTLERRRVSTISENRNGNVPSAGRAAAHREESVSGWNTCRLRCNVIEEACQKYACGKGCTWSQRRSRCSDREGLPDRGCWRTWPSASMAIISVVPSGRDLPAPRSGRYPAKPLRLDAAVRRACPSLFERMKEQVLESKALQTDDTPVAVLDPALRARARGDLDLCRG